MSKYGIIALATLIPALISLLYAYLYGRWKQRQRDRVLNIQDALYATNIAIKNNEERAKKDASITSNLPNTWHNDTDDISFRVPGGPTSKSNKPPGL